MPLFRFQQPPGPDSPREKTSPWEKGIRLVVCFAAGLLLPGPSAAALSFADRIIRWYHR